MNVLEAINTRRSIKHFDANHQLSISEVNLLIKSAMQAPTSFNIQHYRFVLVEDPYLRAQIRHAAGDQAQVTEASLLFVLCADVNAWRKSPHRYWQNAPETVQNIIVPMIQPFYEGKEQLQRDEAQRTIGIVVQTMMLAAKEMGYDSCPMIGFDQKEVQKIINLPDDYLIGLLLTVGKAVKPAWPKPGQLDINDVLIRNQFHFD